MYTGLNDNDGQLDHRRAAELLASRWMENRRYFTTIGTIWRAGIQASWHRGPANTLSLRWARRAALEFERDAA
jgi:hypothetical protein